MSERRHKTRREKDPTSRFFSGEFDEDREESEQRFTDRSKHAQQNKMEKTALLRAAQTAQSDQIESLPIGQVIQVYSLFINVEHSTGIRLCVVRKTLNKLADTSIIVGDMVRFRDTGSTDESGRPEAVIEAVLPRRTVLTRTDSFHMREQHPIVANADQVLIVASLILPAVKWGLIDRMIVASLGGGLRPIVCLNKIDLAESTALARKEFVLAKEVLTHYATLDVHTVQTSATTNDNIDGLAAMLKDKATVLAGHSGVGKSTLIGQLEPGLDIRIGEISAFTDKGRHTTTSARRYVLTGGGQVIDTPGVKMFGLWNMTPESLIEYYPDITNKTAPPWRIESYERSLESLKGRTRD